MRLLLVSGLLALAGTLSAADKTGKPIPFDFSARVVVDEQGKPQRVEFSERMPKGLQEMAEQRIRQWQFEPARVNGVAKAGVTHVFVDACAVPNANDGMTVSMGYRTNGAGLPGLASFITRPPKYPLGVVLNGLEGSFRVTMTVGPDGHATVDAIEGAKSKRAQQAFEQTLRAWVASLRYLPEEIDGKPGASQVRVSVDFGLGGGARDESKRSNPDQCLAVRQANGQSSQPVVMDSSFKPITTS